MALYLDVKTISEKKTRRVKEKMKRELREDLTQRGLHSTLPLLISSYFVIHFSISNGTELSLLPTIILLPLFFIFSN